MQVIRLSQQAGLVRVGYVVLDGTTIRTNAAKPTHRAIRGRPITKRMVLDEPARRRIFPARPTLAAQFYRSGLSNHEGAGRISPRL